MSGRPVSTPLWDTSKFSFQEYTLHVHEVLQLLLENKFFVKAEKYEFHPCSISFLGYIFESGQVRMDPKNIQAVAQWLKTMPFKTSSNS